VETRRRRNRSTSYGEMLGLAALTAAMLVVVSVSLWIIVVAWRAIL
jgi:hypothetical protein